MNESELILRVAAEGGGLRLYRTQTPKGCIFTRKVLDQSMLMLDGTVLEHEEAVETWEEALGLLGRYRWHRFVPVTVHPEFQARILDEVRRRYDSDNNERSGLRDWEEACGDLDG